MLKLSKGRHQDAITITIREREHTFNVSFLIAVTLATAFHVVALLTFRVVGPADKPMGQAPPMSLVEADLTMGGTIDVAGGDVQRLFMRHPPPEEPTPQDVTTSEAFRRYDLGDTLPQGTQGLEFLPMARVPYEAGREPLRFSHAHTPLCITVSGFLAQYPYDKEALGTLLVPRPSDKTIKTCSLCYQVLMDARTGTLFWYEKVGDVVEKTAEQVAVNLLQRLKFLGDGQDEDIVKGMVEFRFNVEDGRDPLDFLQEL